MNRIAVIGIIVKNHRKSRNSTSCSANMEVILQGRMGIPYRERKIHVISIAMDAPQDTINALTGKIGRLEGISAKAVYSK